MESPTVLNKREANPINVIFLTSSYPRTRDDSASVFLRYLAESLRKLNVHIHVLAPADAEIHETDTDGITIDRFRYFPQPWQRLAYGSGVLSNLKRNPALYFQVPFFIISMTYALIRLIRQHRPHIIHAHWILPQGIVAIFAKRLYRIPIIITAHGGDAFGLSHPLLQRIKRLCLQRCDAWTSNTRRTAAATGFELPRPADIIPMGVDIEHFSAGRREILRQNIRDNEKIILFVGRLVEKKGVDDLLKAFSLLAADVRKITTLWIIGSGEQNQRLHALANNLGISNNVKFWGTIPNTQLPNYYAAADIFVGPSVEASDGDTEGQGIVFLESFAARLAVVATKIGGIPDVVEHGHTGILVEPRKPEKLTSAIEMLLLDEKFREKIAENAYQQVKKNYGWEKISQKFLKLYLSLITQ